MSKVPVTLTKLKTYQAPNEDLDFYTWGTWDGRRLKPRDFEDTHLANVIVHLVHQNRSHKLAALLYEEAQRRGLSDDFILTNHPFLHEQSGTWMIWDFDRGGPVPAVTLAKLVEGNDVEK